MIDIFYIKGRNGITIIEPQEPSPWLLLMGDRDEVLSNSRLAQEVLCDCSAIETELAELHREIEVVSELTRKSIYENARFAINQDEFNERHQGYMERHRIATEQVADLEGIMRERQAKNLAIETFLRQLQSRSLAIDEFDERLWVVAVDTVMVIRDGGLMFRFKDGTEVRV